MAPTPVAAPGPANRRLGSAAANPPSGGLLNASTASARAPDAGSSSKLKFVPNMKRRVKVQSDDERCVP